MSDPEFDHCLICGAVRWPDELVYNRLFDGFVCVLGDHPRVIAS